MGVLRIIVSSVSSLVGLTSMITFIILRNYAAAVLGFISCITDTILLFIHYLDYKRRLLVWYDTNDIRKFTRIGIFVASLGILCIGYFTTVQIMLKLPMLPVDKSGTIPIVWSIVVLRSGILLIYYGIKYQEMDTEEHRRLL